MGENLLTEDWMTQRQLIINFPAYHGNGYQILELGALCPIFRQFGRSANLLSAEKLEERRDLYI